MNAEYISVALAVPEPPEVKVNTSKGWVEYGKKHSYWGELIKLRKKSPTQRSVTATKAALLRGGGFSYDQKNKHLHEFIQNMGGKGKSGNAQLGGVTADKGFLNAWAVQVVWNQAGDSIAEIHHQPIRTVACGPMNDDGVIEQYWLCRDWSKSGEAKFKPVSIAAFNPETAARDKVQLYVRMVPSDSNDYYPEPECDAALNYLQLESDLSEFHLSNVQNNFALGNILTVPEDPVDDVNGTADSKRKAFKSEVEKNFVGPKGKKLMVLFGITGDNAAQVLSYNAQNNDNLYDTYSNLCVEKILAANRVTSPVIVGLPGGASLGGDANTIRAAYELYYNTVVRPEQVDIIDGFLELLSHVKGVELDGDADTPALDIVTTLPVKQTFSEGLLQDIADVDELRAMVDMTPREQEEEDGENPMNPPAANDPNAVAQAALRGSVGGITAIMDLMERVSKQVIDRAAAIGILKNFYGLTEEQAEETLGKPKPLEVGEEI
ncbi:hypothetical protein [Rufibacter quisquiliarum]|uniref:Phage portal protein n=1 Tax=Rufibacter quisquiliarum TaxID=1549639 RepID=A0A839GHA2_9BACT|nr:hypothetical protein [Rufibacter quisquiliarum]MBA9076069.1 hypothetical protein [Rufibacter quisquiliarum]